MDEALGQPCQDAVLDVVNSFHKAPVLAVAPAAASGPQPEAPVDEFDDAEDEGADTGPAEGQPALPAEAGGPANPGLPGGSLHGG